MPQCFYDPMPKNTKSFFCLTDDNYSIKVDIHSSKMSNIKVWEAGNNRGRRGEGEVSCSFIRLSTDTSSYHFSLFFPALYLYLFFKNSFLRFPLTISLNPNITTSYPQSYHPWLYPCDLYICSLMTLPIFPHYHLPHTLINFGLFFSQCL